MHRIDLAKSSVTILRALREFSAPSAHKFMDKRDEIIGEIKNITKNMSSHPTNMPNMYNFLGQDGFNEMLKLLQLIQDIEVVINDYGFAEYSEEELKEIKSLALKLIDDIKNIHEFETGKYPNGPEIAAKWFDVTESNYKNLKVKLQKNPLSKIYLDDDTK